MPRNLFGLRDIVKNFLFLNKNNRKAKVVSLQRNNIVRSVHQFKINIPKASSTNAQTVKRGAGHLYKKLVKTGSARNLFNDGVVSKIRNGIVASQSGGTQV
jgi:hypothetical protein